MGSFLIAFLCGIDERFLDVGFKLPTRRMEIQCCILHALVADWRLLSFFCAMAWTWVAPRRWGRVLMQNGSEIAVGLSAPQPVEDGIVLALLVFPFQFRCQ